MEAEMVALIPMAELPEGFSYPEDYLRVIELGLTDLEPWWIMDGAILFNIYRGLAERYPDDSFVPFAKREDNDDVACWDLAGRNIVIVHDYASPGRHRRGEFKDFYAWFRQAVEDLIEFDG
ncbi:hypothetical protein MXD59_13415 [Frankia sp. Ag45/Mut15]|uniref:Knr4/Smi1-like domain-containing protein n=2 Tax=Frankia TaxID=1854 RepID=A0ABT0JYZ9_9ACTN|nr:hypothetical protein [Frankia umida]MCK9876765.1 hypothetical protein [Frankia umida]